MRPINSVCRTGALLLISAAILLTHAACAGPDSPPATVAPKATSAPQNAVQHNATAAEETAVASSASQPTESAPLPASATPIIMPPAHPLRAWTIAADGAVFVLDAAHTLYRLAAADLSPLTQSGPLFTGPVDAPAFLLASDTHLFVGDRQSGQTLVLNRTDFTQAGTLEHAGPMALDPVAQHLFLVPQFAPDDIFNGRFLAYNLPNLNQPSLEFELSCLRPQDLAANPSARRLYALTLGICSSPPHQRQAYTIYNLDTLAEIGQSTPELGALTRPAVAEQAGVLATTLDAKSGLFFDDNLFILDSQGQPLGAYQALDGLPAISPDGAWLYLLRRRGLWVLQGPDFSLQSILFFDQSPPADLALSPAGDTLYLFGNGWLNAQPTAHLQTLGIPPISPFPSAWSQPDPNAPSILPARLYRSPQLTRDGASFAQYGQETYRTVDGGQSWQLLVSLLEPELSPIQTLSLSPDFAADQTLVAQTGSTLHRSTDNGDTWQEWTPSIAFVSEQDGNRELYVMSQDGEEQLRLTDTPAAEENPAWSPAWTRLAFQSNRNGNWDIFSMRIDCAFPDGLEIGGACEVQQLTADAADDLLPAWSPDGRSIAFVSMRDGNPEIYIMDSDGQNQRRLTFNPTGDWRPAWLPDSQRLVFAGNRNGNNDIYQLAVPPSDTASLASEPELTALTTDPADDRDPAIGNNTLYFLSDRDGIMRVYRLDLSSQFAQPYPATETAQPEGHPSPDGNSPTILVAAEYKGVSTIYRVIGAEYTPLTSGSTFDGQPAWGPALWDSVEAMPEGGLVK